MTDQRRPPGPDDEPVIGLDDLETVFAHAGTPEPEAVSPEGELEGAIGEEGWPEVGPEEEYPEYGAPGARSYYPYGFEPEAPAARQPMFYVLLILSVLVGGLFVFLLLSLLGGNGESPLSPTAGAPSVLISVDAPLNGDRVEVGQEIDVKVRARASEEIQRFELYRGADLIDWVNAGAPDVDGVYHADLKLRFETKGDFSLIVRVVTVSGAQQDSPEVQVLAVEPVSGEVPTVEGRGLTLVTLREGPGENFASAGQLQPGEQVVILGKTRDASWLYIDKGGGLWVRATAIEAFDSLALVPVREPTPTPIPPTPTPEPSPSVTASPSGTVSPTVPADAPDFIPANATLAQGGAILRVTVANIAPADYKGPLVVSVSNIGAGGTLAQVFDVDIPASGSVVVELEIEPPVTETKIAQVTVDPDLAIPESNEDNNTASFSVTPPVEAPDLVIAGVAVVEGFVEVTIRNDGGPLAPSAVTVRVTVRTDADVTHTAETEEPALALATGQVSAPIRVVKPGSGTATVQVLVNGNLAVQEDGVELP